MSVPTVGAAKALAAVIAKSRAQSRLVAVLLFGATLCLYWQVTGHEFVSYDDQLYITGNRMVQQGLTRASIVWAFTTAAAANWHPVTWLSHLVDVELFGLRSGWHHLVNVLLHGTNAALLFLMLRGLTGTLWPSALVAALFASHPLHVESVAWAAERKDVLSSLFGLLALGAHLWQVRHPHGGGRLPVLLLLALGLLAKPMLVTLPFLLLLLDWWPLGRWRGSLLPPARLWGEKLPLFALAAASCWITYRVQSQAGVITPGEVYAFPVRAANLLQAYAGYLLKTAWPLRLAVFYPHPGALPSAGRLLGAAVLLTAVSLLALRFRRSRPHLLVGWLWYLGTLVPVIGIVQVGLQAMADRYTYLPLVGVFLAAAWCLPALPARHRGVRGAAGALALLLVFVAAGLCHRQTKSWRTSRLLFEQALRATEGNFVAHLNLGNVLLRSGRLDEAVGHYEAALRAKPDLAEAHNQLGNALFRTGRLPEALECYRLAVLLRPGTAETRFNLGLALLKAGATAEATAHFQEALRLDPGLEAARVQLDRLRPGPGREPHFP